MQLWMRILLSVVAAAQVSACTIEKAPPVASGVKDDVAMTAAEKQAWIAKAARVLRYGATVDDPDEMEALMALDRPAVVDKLMADPRFGDAALDFNLYFLGFKPGDLYGKDESAPTSPSDRFYAPGVLSRPAAIRAARNLLTDGDYFALFSMEQPTFAWRTGFANNMPELNLPPTASDAVVRKAHLDLISTSYDKLLAKFGPSAAGPLDREAGCNGFGDDEIMNTLNTSLFSAGIPQDIILVVVTRWQPEISIMCGSGAAVDAVYAQIVKLKDRVAQLFAEADGYTAGSYPVASVLDLKESTLATVDPAAFGSSMTVSGYWNILQNSSTNFNRRRSAYMLRTYFCDDLTPLAVVQPDVHAEGAHASEPGCQACHYKLDPMGGFFRYRGFFGSDAFGKPFIAFDDNASVFGEALEKYLATWKFPAASTAGRTWNVGFVASTKFPENNVYEPEVAGQGSTEPVTELYKIIAQSPRVKQCLTQRMAEYFLGTKQAYDGTWLSGMAQRFDAPLASSSKVAKSVIKELVLSRTFSTKNPDPGVCYDPPEAASDPVPCAVSYIIKNNCVSCHDDGFDLADKDVLTAMEKRLTTSVQALRMPKNKDMPDPERVRLVKWLQQELAPGTGGQ